LTVINRNSVFLEIIRIAVRPPDRLQTGGTVGGTMFADWRPRRAWSSRTIRPSHAGRKNDACLLAALAAANIGP
jgi:hypothetical protein